MAYDPQNPFARILRGELPCVKAYEDEVAVEAPGIVVAQFNGSAAGQTVPHVHFHIVPRKIAARIIAAPDSQVVPGTAPRADTMAFSSME